MALGALSGALNDLAAVLPDAEMALVSAVLSLLPADAAVGAEQIDAILAELDERARAVIADGHTIAELTELQP